jgi:hypothetical protein
MQGYRTKILLTVSKYTSHDYLSVIDYIKTLLCHQSTVTVTCMINTIATRVRCYKRNT